MLEEKTKNQINDLIKNFENPALKLMVSEALKIWEYEDINPGNGAYGVIKEYYTDIYSPDEEMCPCILGAAIIGKKGNNDYTDENITNILGLSDDDIGMVIEVFDYQSSTSSDGLVYDRKILIQIRDLLTLDKNSKMTFTEEE